MSEAIHLAMGDTSWEVLPEVQPLLLGAGGLRLEEWRATGQAVIVKHGPHRTVWRVTLPGLSCYVKHNRLWNARAWLRQLVRAPKSRLEYERAREVAARGIPTVEPLAVGEGISSQGPADSYLVTRSLEGVQPLDTFLETLLPSFAPPRRERVAQRVSKVLGAFVARMHDAGVVHHDLHPGNLLLRLDADDTPTLFLIDLHAVRVGGPLAWPAARANLVILNHWFSLRANRSDRLRFWRAYSQARQSTEALPFALPVIRRLLPVELEERTWESNLRFWRNRDRRCVVSNRYYQSVRAGALRGVAVRDLTEAALAALLADPDAPFQEPGAKLLKSSRSSTVVEFDMALGGTTRRVIWKRFRVTSWKDPLTSLFRRSAALRSWVSGHGLRERALPTPRPLLVLHHHRAGLPCQAYLLVEKVENAQELQRYVLSLSALPCFERQVILRQRIDEAARLVRELHRRRLGHRDLKAPNLLVADRIWLIDLVGVSRYGQLPRERRVQNLARLNASFYQTTAFTRTDRLRFLRVYLQWGLYGRSSWKRWWRQVEAATLAKVAQNQRRGRVLA